MTEPLPVKSAKKKLRSAAGLRPPQAQVATVALPRGFDLARKPQKLTENTGAYKA